MTKKPDAEQKILAAILNGGQQAERALKEVYLDNRAAIGLFIRRNKGTEEEAKDVMQDAMIAFYENVRKGVFKGESKISTYLYSIARFIWLNKLKRQKNESTKLAKLPVDVPEPTLPARILEGESKQALLAIFNQLGEDCQKVLMDSLYYGWNMKEIAQRMEYDNEQIARNKKYLCLKKLKKMIQANPEILQHLKS